MSNYISLSTYNLYVAILRKQFNYNKTLLKLVWVSVVEAKRTVTWVAFHYTELCLTEGVYLSSDKINYL